MFLGGKYCSGFILGWILSATVVPPSYAESDFVETEVNIEAQITQLWTNEHPAKLFKCWGRAMQVELFNEPLKDTSNENSGSISLNHHNTNQPFTNFNPITGSWTSDLSEDRVFTLSFNQKVQAQQTTYRHQTCSTEKMYSQLDASSTSFKSHASMLVPNDVYLIRVKVLKKNMIGKSVHQLDARVLKAARVQEDNSKVDHSFKGDKGLSVEEDLQYFFVKPNDRIDFAVSWESSSASDASIDVQYEIKMMGQDMCERDLWALNSRMKPNLKELAELIQLDRPGADPHVAISRLACLRSSKYMGSLLYSHHATDLVDFLTELNNQLLQKQEQVNETAPPFLRELSIVASMSLYDFAKTVLVDMSQYCDSRPVVIMTSGNEQAFGYIRGFHYAARHWHRIRLLFEQANSGLIPLFESFSGLLKSAEDQQMKYSDINNETTLRVMEHVFLSIFGSSFRTLSIVEYLIKGLPLLRINKGNSLALMAELRKGVETFESLELEFRTLLSNFVAGADAKISVEKFNSKLESYKKSLQAVQALTLENMKWFEYDESFFEDDGKQFRVDLLPVAEQMRVLNERFVYEIGKFLFDNFGHKIGNPEVIDFIQWGKITKLHQKVDQCLRTYGEAK